MGCFLQGELPKDDIQFINSAGETDEAIPTINMDPQFMRM
jgi:hypothetical protein